MKDLRNLVLELVNAFFDGLDATERSKASTEVDTASDYGFEFLDDEDDSFYESESESEDDRAISASDNYDGPSWPKVGDVPANGPRANSQPQPTISWPKVSTPAVAKPNVGWPKVGDLVGTNPAGQMVTTNEGPVGVVVNTQPQSDFEETVDTDGRGRACCPAHLVNAAGFKPGDHVFVSVRAHKQPGLVLLHKASQTGHLSTYTVDRDRNIRLSHVVLTRGNLGAATRIRFKANKDRILVLQG